MFVLFISTYLLAQVWMMQCFDIWCDHCAICYYLCMMAGCTCQPQFLNMVKVLLEKNQTLNKMIEEIMVLHSCLLCSNMWLWVKWYLQFVRLRWFFVFVMPLSIFGEFFRFALWTFDIRHFKYGKVALLLFIYQFACFR